MNNPAFASCLNTFWVICNFLWCFVQVYFKVQGKKVKTNMDLIFEHPAFNSSRERVKCVKVTWIATRNIWKLVVRLIRMGATMYFPSQNRSVLLMNEHLYSTSVVNVTINGGMDDNVKWVFFGSLKKMVTSCTIQYIKSTRMFISHI